MSGVGLVVRPGNGDFIARCLGSGSSPVASFVGAGGKTTAVFWLARELAARGRRVLVTTTTRMYRPEPDPGLTVLIEADLDRRVAALRKALPGPGVVALYNAFEAAENKVAGFLPGEIDALREAALVDAILVEADGARHRLLKAPAAHEPCIADTSDVVIALAGGAAIGCPADPAAVHRWPQFAAITGLGPGDPIGVDALRRLLAHPEGMFKNAPARAARHLLVNVHGTADASLLATLAQLAAGDSGLDGLWVGDLRQVNPFSHAWLRDRGPT